MSSRPALSGEVQSDEVTRLKREIVGLEKELREAKAEAAQAKQASADSIQAIRALRRQLDPFYAALKMLYGEISRVEATGGQPDWSANQPRPSESLWRDRIAKVGGASGRILEVLLEGGGPMTLMQIRSAARSGGATSARLSELGARNWVQKVGHGSYALKET